jgi:hypothetical protein
MSRAPRDFANPDARDVDDTHLVTRSVHDLVNRDGNDQQPL